MFITTALTVYSAARTIADLHKMATSNSPEEVRETGAKLARRTVLRVCCPVVGEFLEGGEEILDAAMA